MCICHTARHLCIAWTVSKLAKHQFSCPLTASRILLSFIMIIILHDNIWRKLPRFWNLFAKNQEKRTDKSERNLATGESLRIKVNSSMKVSLL